MIQKSVVDGNFKVTLSAAGYQPSNSNSIPKDSNGYYKVRLGAFNVFNSVNAYYTDKGVKELLTNPNSFFVRRLNAGQLVGEMGHPKMTPGQTASQFMSRNAAVDENNIAFHIKKVDLEETGEVTVLHGIQARVLAVVGWIKPAGPKGEYLREALDNPDRNVAFSVRSLSRDVKIKGIVVKETRSILTWDWVVEPGIEIATTFDLRNHEAKKATMNQESLHTIFDFDITPMVADDMLKDISSLSINQESAVVITEVSNIIKSIYGNTHRVLDW